MVFEGATQEFEQKISSTATCGVHLLRDFLAASTENKTFGSKVRDEWLPHKSARKKWNTNPSTLIPGAPHVPRRFAFPRAAPHKSRAVGQAPVAESVW
jgi:hypothetical protein